MEKLTIETLSNDVLYCIVKQLDNRSHFFSCCKRFNAFGKKYKLRGYELAIQEIRKISPYSSIIGYPQEQLSLIKRGHQTVYTVHLDFTELEKDTEEYYGYGRKRVYKLKGIRLGFDKNNKYDNQYPLFFLKGSPALKETLIPIFGIAKDISMIKCDESGPYEIPASRFCFEEIFPKENGDNHNWSLENSSLWNKFCDDAIRKVYLSLKYDLKEKQFDERKVILDQIEKREREQKQKEKEYLKTLTQQERDLYYTEKNRNWDFVRDPKLEEIDEKHRQELREFKIKIKNELEGIMREKIIDEAKTNLMKNKTYNGYVFDICSQI